jgi:hypothetical protein
VDFVGERSLCAVVPSDPSRDAAIAALQLQLIELCEDLEPLLVTPLPAGEDRMRTARRMAQLGRSIAVLTDACRILATSPRSVENALD